MLRRVIILLVHNIYCISENSPIFSTYELALEADCTEVYEIHTCSPVFYKWFLSLVFTACHAETCRSEATVISCILSAFWLAH